MLKEGDGRAEAGYALLLQSCKARTTPAEYAAELTAAVGLYGRQQIEDLTVDQISGGLRACRTCTTRAR